MRYGALVRILFVLAAAASGTAGCNSAPPEKPGIAATKPAEGAPWQGAVPAGYPKWPPSHLFQFIGFDTTNRIAGVYVDSTNVYWAQKVNHFMRVEKAHPGSPELFFDCSDCDYDQSASDGSYFYSLAGSRVVRVSIADRTQTDLPLDWNHSGGGAALTVDDRYVYTAMNGCPALTRIDKQTLAKEVMQIDGVTLPGRGRTALAKSGDALVCGSPSQIFVIDSWGSARSIFTDVHQGFSVTASGDRAYFLEDGDDLPGVGSALLAGGGGQHLVLDKDGGFAVPLLSIPSLGKVIWGNHKGVRSLDMRDSTLSRIELGDTQSVAADETHAYAVVEGFMPQTVNGRPVSTYAYWIAQAPLAELAAAPASP